MNECAAKIPVSATVLCDSIVEYPSPMDTLVCIMSKRKLQENKQKKTQFSISFLKLDTMFLLQIFCEK